MISRMTRHEWIKEVSQSGLGDTETFEATYDICMNLIRRDISGDFVEAGVYAGVHPAIMARAIMDCLEPGSCEFDEMEAAEISEQEEKRKRRVHLFDSFEGIPKGGPEDHELQHKPAGESACSLEQVKANLKRWGLPEELFVFHKGFFDAAVPQAVALRTFPGDLTNTEGVHQIAFLRLDGDLYDSTKVCLDYLLPLVSRGGWVCVDDFNLSGCRKAVLETIIPAPCYWRVPTK